MLNGRRPASPVKQVTNPRSSSRPSISHDRHGKVESGGVAGASRGGHDSVMSSALPDELGSDGEEPVAMETYDTATTRGMLMLSVANTQLALQVIQYFCLMHDWLLSMITLNKLPSPLIVPWRSCAYLIGQINV